MRESFASLLKSWTCLKLACTHAAKLLKGYGPSDDVEEPQPEQCEPDEDHCWDSTHSKLEFAHYYDNSEEP